MNRLNNLFLVDVERDDTDLVVRLSVEATYNEDGTNLVIGKITDSDNGYREVLESELTVKELQQLIDGLIKQVLRRETA